MRNTPYARYTIGNRNHAIFDLDNVTGLIQGIIHLSDPKEMKASDLQRFEHLAHGETKVFTDGSRIEVVDFGGYRSNGGFVSSLHSQVVVLEANSKLTGPAAWRLVAPPVEPAETVMSEKGFSVGDAAMIATVVAMFVGAALFSVMAALMMIGMTAFLGLTLAIFNACQASRKRTIERMGSVYILAPLTRTWAGAPA
jgi:hypothetical protein